MEYSYLDEKPYENIFHSYKTIKPNKNNTDYIQFDFPKGNYMVDCMYLAIKFENDIVTREMMDNANLDIENLFTDLIPLGINSQPIPFKFICAYNEICRLNKSELYYYIPLVKMSSLVIGCDESVLGSSFDRLIQLRLNKNNAFWDEKQLCKGNSNDFALSVLKQKTNNNFEKLSPELMNTIVDYTVKNLEYELTYRETKFFDANVKLRTPEPSSGYIFNTINIGFYSENTKSIAINDKNNRFEFNTILIATDIDDDNCINEIEFSLKNKEGDGLLEKSYFKHLFTNGIYRITKEYAALFNIGYQFNKKYYMVDISRFMNTFPRAFIKNYFVIRKPGENLREKIEELYNQRLLQYQQPFNIDNINNVEEKDYGIDVVLKLVLNSEYTGAFNIYLF